jgi:hypothetical protein
MKYHLELLLPGAAEREAQGRLATQVFQDMVAAPHERAHAKCWLTYRVADGTYSLDYWNMHVGAGVIDGIADETQRVRWETSQRTAEFYLNGLRRDVWEMPWSGEDPLAEWLRIHPSFALQYMRVNAVMAYRALLLGNVEECRQRVFDALHTGLRRCATLQPVVHALRLLEMRDDWHAYVTLILIGQRAGCLPVVHAPWATREMILRDDGHLPYVRCLIKLGTGQAGGNKIW